MRRLVVAPRAVRDAATAARWYERQRRGLGDEFSDSVAQAIARVTRDPELFPVVYADLRRASVERFPYALTFRLLDDAVRVVACAHDRRHPRRWQTRR